MSDNTTRRSFLKTSGAAIGAAATLGVNAGAFAANDETIRVGLIGCGGRGRGAASQALSTEGPVELVSMADAFTDRLDDGLKAIKKNLANSNPDRIKVADDRKYIGFDAYKEMLANDDIDLIILATPPGFRPIHFEAAIDAGKHVFMEKPVATDAAGVRKVLAAVEEAKKKDLKVGVGLQRHHQYTYLETMKRLKDGAIGDIVAMRAYWNSGGVWDPRKSREECRTEMEYQMRNWYYYNWLCGDHITEQHIHNIDVCNWLKDDYPVECIGMGGRQVRTDPKYGEIFDHFAVQYKYADGSYMFSECRHIRNCFNSVSEHAHGSKGYSNIGGAQIVSGDDKWRYRGEKNNPYQTEHDDLFAAIRANEPYNEGEYGAKSTMTSIMGRMAVYSGKPVKWDAAINSEKSIMPEDFSFDAEPPTVPDENGAYPIPVPGVTEVI
ncbi:MAG: dehydrogenase [Planctomycetaceae bacterium]|nr:dehydrogenase [Planctomycetaceae bacterium]